MQRNVTDVENCMNSTIPKMIERILGIKFRCPEKILFAWCYRFVPWLHERISGLDGRGEVDD